MQTIKNESVENKFLLLSVEEKASIISHGVALRFSEWKKRLFLAESKARFFEDKYNLTIAELDTNGLPDNAGYEMHEDYIQWQHWIDAGKKAKQMVKNLEVIAGYGVKW